MHKYIGLLDWYIIMTIIPDIFTLSTGRTSSSLGSRRKTIHFNILMGELALVMIDARPEMINIKQVYHNSLASTNVATAMSAVWPNFRYARIPRNRLKRSRSSFIKLAQEYNVVWVCRGVCVCVCVCLYVCV